MPFEIRKRGFTLLEILIVISLLLVIMGMSVPWIFREQARSELKNAATQLQGELYATRLHAMESGEAYVFRYRGSGNMYEIMPKSVYDATLPKESTSPYSEVPQTRSVGSEIPDSLELAPSSSDSHSDAFMTPQDSTGDYYRKSLPVRIMFAAVKQPPSNTSGGMDDSFAYDVPMARNVGSELSSTLELDNSFEFGAETKPSTLWSEPIVFFPNGRTSNASFALYTTGDYEYRVELNLRGLTGTARIGEIKVTQ